MTATTPLSADCLAVANDAPQVTLAHLLQPTHPQLVLHTPTSLSAQKAETAIQHVTSDSRTACHTSVFVALVGSHTDGHDYLPQAIAQGTPVVVIQANRLAKVLPLIEKQPHPPVVVVADNTYQALAVLAARLYGQPAQALRLVGVTGTNGKTTVTHLVEQMLLDAGERTGLIGTLGARVQSDATAQTPAYAQTGHTTPMATDMQALLAQFKAHGTKTVVMEVSSHALEQHRVYGCPFAVAVHTNLTQDHLDYHKTMAAYFEAKALLFSGLAPGSTAVINADDTWADKFIAKVPAGVPILRYGINHPQCEVRATDLAFDIEGARFTLVTPKGTRPLQIHIAGRFGVYNALAAAAAGLAVGLSLEQIATALERVRGVRGRFEVVAQAPYVIVDYAHTPDGLDNVLAAARLVTPKKAKLFVVFGCGGDRDATKRPKMGRIAEELADVLVVTSDNPRSEDPQQIITDILGGIQSFDNARMFVMPDREQAIHHAMDLAGPEDIIVVAGKGHEDYQILADRTIDFDDKAVVQAYAASKPKLSV